MPFSINSRQATTLLLGISAAVLILTFSLLGWTVEWLWLKELGYDNVFWRVNLTKIGLFVATFVPVFLFFWLNVRALIQVAIHPDAGTLNWLINTSPKTWGHGPWVRASRILLPTIGALFFAMSIASKWDILLRFQFAMPFGQTDPIFGFDIGFYVFELPFYSALQSTVTAIALVGIGANAIFCHYLGLFRTWSNLGSDLRTYIFRMLATNGVLFLTAWAAGYYLERYELLFDSGGTVHGVGYTDSTITIPALTIMAGASLALMSVLVVTIRMNRPQIAILGAASLGALAFVSLFIVPTGFQYFVVEPTELQLEQPYLKRNIDHTRRAFGIDNVEERFYPAITDLTFNDMASSQDTLKNIRLWDWRPLLQAIRQMQEIRLYYQFYNIDVDRYKLDSGVRQVMISARELSERLPTKAETWLNRHLQFTHGYGVAMSLAAHENEKGAPTLIAKDLPPVTTNGLKIDEPSIYFGEMNTGYRIVNTKIKELSYPKGDANVYISYTGKGGIELNSYWRKMLFAWNQFDVNILLSSYITDKSRIQIWRAVSERVSRVAPFLKFDRDPYIVVSDGHLFWIQDAYTISGSYPYSEPFRRQFNYIRNPVKIVVDAYHGSVNLYTVDDKDPILKVYQAAFPDMFKPLTAMSADLKSHLRYPPDMFTAQVESYGKYHMNVPQVFYNNEDLWTLSREKYGGESIPMQPYFILMRLPNEDKLQFLLMTPLTPVNKDNMIGWMAGRSDFPGYGQLVVYKLPKDRLIYGPLQIEALIDQDPVISRQLALWDQRGSKVIRGNLIVVPINHSLLYVEPVYLVAEVNDLPQLQRVIVAYGTKIVMEPTLQQALDVIFGTAPPSDMTADTPASAARAQVRDETLQNVRRPYERAQKALQEGDWRSFGEAMDQLKHLIDPGSAPLADPGS